MKKFIAVLSVLGLVACTNPSVEDGLAGLEAALAELEAQLEGIDVPQMQADLADIEADVAQMTEDVEAANLAMEDAISEINAISQLLDSILDDVKDLPTTEDIQAILADVEGIQGMIDQLVLLADYDYDGVINGLDQCPDTEIGATVDEQGCSEAQKQD